MYPDEATYYLFYSAFVILFASALWRLSQIGRRPKNYPPGPPTLPIVGNLHLIPREKRHLQFEAWAREYGPIYSLMVGTKLMVVLNSDTAIKDLIDKRGATYSSRPESYIAQDILSGGLRVLFMACVLNNSSNPASILLPPKLLALTIRCSAAQPWSLELRP